jgi:hypothetical protein
MSATRKQASFIESEATAESAQMRSFWMYEQRLYVVINFVAVAIHQNKVNARVSIDPFGENGSIFPYR